MDIKFKFRYTFYYLLIVLLFSCSPDINIDVCDIGVNNESTYNPIFFPHKITTLVIHCTATPKGRNLNRKDLDKIWESRNFSRPGYHMVVDLDGHIIFQGEVIDDCLMDYDEMTWGVANLNHKFLHISYVGGVDEYGLLPEDTRTPRQKTSLVQIIKFVKSMCPDIQIKGHKDFSNKACPSFEVSEFLLTLDSY